MAENLGQGMGITSPRFIFLMVILSQKINSVSLPTVNQPMGTFCLFNTENPREKGKKKGVGPSRLFARHYSLGPRAALCLLQQAHAAGAYLLKTKPGSARSEAILPRVPPHACLLCHQRVWLIICLLGTITGRLAAFSLVNVNIVSRTQYLRCEIRCY